MKGMVIPHGIEVEITEEDRKRGVVEFECPACEGSGVFEMHDGESQECVPCSGTGTKEASLF